MFRPTLVIRLASVLVCIGFIAGCEMFDKDKKSSSTSSSAQKMQADGGKVAVANIQPSKAAATQPANQKVTGTATFTQMGNDVRVVADVGGLKPGKHGFHIHQKGDLSDPALVSAGPHYNPGNHKHGGPDTPEHHAGDMGNLTADESGHAMVDVTLHDTQLDALVGKSVIVHATEDDMKTDPSGNSGGRVAGGVIEMKK
jgi:Cu-Zn family superoxide dismutase